MRILTSTRQVTWDSEAFAGPGRLSAPHGYPSGKTVLLGDTRTGSLLALNTDTGAERWRFWTDGPVRLAPAVSNGRVYVVSDDGYLYCLALADGRLLWRFFGGLGEGRLLANEQLSSMWPARGGPVVAAGRVYFAAGVWPFMGVPIYALDAESGREIWTNDRSGVLHANRAYHQYKAYWGTSPQGALALDGNTLVIPSCRSQPLFLDAASGEITRAEAGWKDYGGGGDSRVAVAGKLLFAGGYVYARDTMLPLCLNAAAKGLKPFTCLPVSDGKLLYVATRDGIEGHDLSEATYGKYTGNYGVHLVRCDTKTLWKMPETTKPMAMIKAGSRLYIAMPKKVLALTAKPGETVPKIIWQTETGGMPSELAAADGKLFVTTREGRVLCFGGKRTETRMWPRNLAELTPVPKWEAAAQRFIKLSGTRQGYCVVLGLADGGLVMELLRQSKFKLIAMDEDPRIVQLLREKLAAADQLGQRVSVHVGDLKNPALPQYLASLLVSEDASVPGGLVESVLPILRPYGGVACLPVPASKRDGLARHLASRQDEMTAEFAADLAIVRQVGGPAGAANWEHEAAGPGNTWMSRDRAVRAPLGVLWFGGATENRKLYRSRYSDPCTARVVDGRLFIYGNGVISAVDAYTGRVLWKRGIPKQKPYRNKRSYSAPGPFPGPIGDGWATAWYVAHRDGLYISYGQVCEVWSPSTGKTLHTFTLESQDEQKLFWGDLRVWEDMLIVGAEFPTGDVESEFVAADVEALDATGLSSLITMLKTWPPLTKVAKSAEETDGEFAVRSLNLLLEQIELEKHVPAELLDTEKLGERRAEAVQKTSVAVKKHRDRMKYAFTPYLSLKSLNRRLLEACHPGVRRNPDKAYWHNLYPWDGTFTKRIMGLNRQTGDVLWQQVAKYGFPQKAIAVGNGKVFCIDRVEIDRDEFLARRGTPQPSQPSVRAFDARSGKQLWAVDRDVTGYQLMYCPDQDILIQPSSHDPDPPSWSRKKRLQWVRLIAYRGTDGTVLWDNKLELERSSGRHRMWWNWFVHKDTIIVESYYDTHADFYGFDLHTGKQKTRHSALTGTTVPWGFRRRGGCTKNLCSENLVFFRSSTAGYYDAESDAGTVNLAGFRTGCKNSLIPGAGILNAPNYASGCTCNYPVFTALALVHMPSVESWATSTYTWDGARVKRIGINLGAPGDHRAKNGTLWLDYPSVGGESPDIPVAVTPAKPRWFYRHSARMRGGELPWVAASGAEGLSKVTLTLCKAGTASVARYTVRLCFAEQGDLKPGDRVFGIALQGKRVIEQLDIVKEAGRATGLVREFRGVQVADTLNVELISIAGKPTLCGIEVVLETARK
ncbi:MAG: PQQ-binding-like beta-propeller repeat protein [Lentisphaeria bacterium]|nr:PQQ-binding-like beta-propeller repeat protein [Lentisphaeria bacterium]